MGSIQKEKQTRKITVGLPPSVRQGVTFETGKSDLYALGQSVRQEEKEEKEEVREANRNEE